MSEAVMPRVRALTRGLALAAATLIAYVVLLLGFVALAPRRRARGRWASWMQGLWARALLRLLRVRVVVSGTPPRPPFFLVANHLSYVDVLTIASRVPCVFVAKRDVAGWPVLGGLARSVGTIFVDRTSKRDVPRALDALEAAFASGRGVVLFPEGTSSDGAGVLAFRSPLLDLPAKRGEPVYAAGLVYRTPAGEPPASSSVCWWADMRFAPHFVALLRLRSIEARLAFSPTPVHHGDRKVLASQLWREVTALHGRLAAEAEGTLAATERLNLPAS